MAATTFVGSEILVNGTTGGDQDQLTLAGLQGGGFVAGWRQDGTGIVGSSVLAQRFDTAGARNGGEFIVPFPFSTDGESATSYYHSPQVAALDNGGFAFTWANSGWVLVQSGYGTFARGFVQYGWATYDAAGGQTLMGAGGTVNALAGGYRPDIVGLAGGGVALAAADGDSGDVLGYGVAGATAATALVATTAQPELHLARLADGNLATAWFDAAADLVRTAIVAAAGGVLATNTVDIPGTTAGGRPEITALAGGGFVVAWQTVAEGAGGLFAQIFAANGAASGAPIAVANPGTALSEPVVAGLPGGGFALAWADRAGGLGDTSGSAIHARAYAADGRPVTDIIQVNSATMGDQLDPTIAVLADGDVVIGWTTLDPTTGDGSGSSVKAQIIHLAGPTITAASDAGVLLTATTAEDWTITGAAGNDTLAGLAGDDRLVGGLGRDRLAGNAGDDTLEGGDGRDWLSGGAGRDDLTGGGGGDHFVFNDGEFGGSTTATADHILDFNAASGDRINLRPVDANAGLAGDQGFAFLGTAGFTGAAGQLRAEVSGGQTLVLGDTNGDMAADFAILLNGTVPLTAADFLL